MQTIEAIVDADGIVRLPTDIRLPKNRRALLTILDEEPKNGEESNETRNQRLVAAFRKASELNIFRDIDDPVKWQRRLRDEWE